MISKTLDSKLKINDTMETNKYDYNFYYDDEWIKYIILV